MCDVDAEADADYDDDADFDVDANFDDDDDDYGDDDDEPEKPSNGVALPTFLVLQGLRVRCGHHNVLQALCMIILYDDT